MVPTTIDAQFELKKMDDGPIGTEEAGGVRASGDEVSADEGCRAYERKA